MCKRRQIGREVWVVCTVTSALARLVGNLGAVEGRENPSRCETWAGKRRGRVGLWTLRRRGSDASEGGPGTSVPSSHLLAAMLCCAVLDENNFLLLLFCVNWKTLVSSTRGSRSESWGCSLRNGGVP